MKTGVVMITSGFRTNSSRGSGFYYLSHTTFLFIQPFYMLHLPSLGLARHGATTYTLVT
jgi:hypothetical protein